MRAGNEKDTGKAPVVKAPKGITLNRTLPVRFLAVYFSPVFKGDDDHKLLCFLSHHGGGGGGLVLPGGGEDTLGPVVTSQPVDPGLDENQPELGVLVLAAPLQVLADADGLLDQEVDVLREVGSQSLPLQDPQDLVAGDKPDLGDTVTVPEDDTDLRRGQALLGQLVDLVLDV